MGKLTKYETLLWKIRREEEVEVFPTTYTLVSLKLGQAGEQFISSF